MKTTLSSSSPAQLETECLAVVVLDRGSKDKPEPTIETNDSAVKQAAAQVIASGEMTGKNFESTLIHNPTGLKAKRLLLLGGGKAQAFSGFELRRVAGTAVRTLKSRSLRSFAFEIPKNGVSAEQAVKAIVEGAFVGNFDADTYKSDRKDQKIDALTVVADRLRQVAGSARRSAHHRRIAELHPRTRERAFKPHDADHARRPREKDGAGSRTEV